MFDWRIALLVIAVIAVILLWEVLTEVALASALLLAGNCIAALASVFRKRSATNQNSHQERWKVQ